MTKEEILLEIQDCDIEIDRQFRQIEDIYKDIKSDTVKRQYWLNKLKEELK